MKKVLSLTICVVLAISLLAACSGGAKYVWADVVMENILPEPPSEKGKFITNTTDSLWMDVDNISEKQFAEYIEACKNKGFTIDADSSGFSYRAYNASGYALSLYFASSSKQLNIDLKAPMEMSEIKWPESAGGKLLPVPKSTVGKVVSETDKGFHIYIGNTTKQDYAAYIAECIAKGFDVDFNKSEKAYSAKNGDGWKVSITYEGFNIINIHLSAPSNSTAPTQAPTTATKPSSDDKLDADFKAAMDSYEKFIDEYVAIVKKYKANPTDFTILASYSDYMSKYATFVADFEKWDNEDLNTAELAYYIDVQSRVSKKLLEVAQ